jgi:hypothetical protein
LRKIDAIALTNLGQIRRLIEIARVRSCEGRLRQGLECIPIASVVPAESERKNELLTRETYRPIVVRSLSATSNRSRLLSQRLKLPAWST